MFKIIKEVGILKFSQAIFKEIYRKVYLETILGSFSQDKEDLIIEKILGKNGYYVEIGGYHPTRLSNTYRFYKKGWRGVVVEPNPEVKKIFNKIRPRDIFVNAGIGKNKGQLKYYMYLIPALNTFSKKQVDENIEYSVQKTKTIPVIDIKNFLKKYIKSDIDLLSLDVEGWDKIILDNWDWKYKPKVICVEDETIKIDGYKLFAKTKFNSIFSLEN